MLNPDQQRALSNIHNWWNGLDNYFVLDGAGGTGKSYLVSSILSTLENVKPVLLAPTHEALKQLRDKVKGDYEFKTVHASLGISPIVKEDKLNFEHIKIPDLWDNYNLAIIDEASMLDEPMIDLLQSIGIKILFIGHKSQLPPPKENRSISDKCVSPVFGKGYLSSTLRQPMRNQGSLWNFTTYLEDMIYNDTNVVPSKFDIKTKELSTYVRQNKNKFLNSDLKLVAWTNAAIDGLNGRIRQYLYSNAVAKYMPGDLIILTAPLTNIDFLDMLADSNIIQNFTAKRDDYFLYSNTKATVVALTQSTIKLNKHLSIPVHKITVEIDSETHTLFEPIDEEDFNRIKTYYSHLAWAKKSEVEKQKAFKNMHLILSCFAKIKHFFCATTYRLQGSGYPEIILFHNDIARNPNMIERKKHIYVGASRAMENLMIYRGNQL